MGGCVALRGNGENLGLTRIKKYKKQGILNLEDQIDVGTFWVGEKWILCI